MKPFFTYFGGKWRAASRYGEPISTLPICEPFAGSAGYSVRYGAGKECILTDANPKIADVWRWLISADRQDVLELPVGDFHSVDDLEIHPSAKFLIGFWLNKGAASPCKTPSKWMRSKVRPKSYWGPEIRLRIADQIHAIDGWQINHKSYADCEDIEANWFIDPPYQNLPTMYPTRFSDYDGLRDFCMSRRGRVTVCEGAKSDWLPFIHLANTKGLEGVNGGKVSHEYIWQNSTI